MIFILIFLSLGCVCGEKVETVGLCTRPVAATVEFESIEVAVDVTYTRTPVKSSFCINPSVTKNLTGNNVPECAKSTYLEGLNSFSVDDDGCTGYSLWIQAPNQFIINHTENHENFDVLFLANTQITEFIENEDLVNLTYPKMENATLTADETARDGPGIVSFSISGSWCLADSVELHFDNVMHTSHDAGPEMSVSVGPQMCGSEVSFVGIKVDGEIDDTNKYYIPRANHSGISVSLRDNGFSNFKEGNYSVSTYSFSIEGDYDKVDHIYLGVSPNDTESKVEFILQGGNQNYTHQFAPENGICYKFGSIDVSYHIKAMDEYRCDYSSLYVPRETCPRGSSKMDFCSYCADTPLEPDTWLTARMHCLQQSPAGAYYLPKVDSTKIFDIITYYEDIFNGTAWTGYALQDGVWLWGDSTREVDEDIINMDEFNNQPNDVGDCTIVDNRSGTFKLVKVDCTEKHMGPCIGVIEP